MIYDEECIVKDIETLFKTKLNAEILIINAEKNDDIVLETIPADKYVYETLDESLLNFKGFFVLYGMADPGTLKEVSSATILEDVMITVQIATFDGGEKYREKLLRKLIRYRRALRATIINNPDVFRGYAKPLMTSLKPNAFMLGKSVVLSVGIDIKASVSGN